MLKAHNDWMATLRCPKSLQEYGRITDISQDHPIYYYVTFFAAGHITIGCRKFSKEDVIKVKEWLKIK